MKTTLLVVLLTSASICSLQANEFENPAHSASQDGLKPWVETDLTNVTIDAPATENLTVMNVRVYDQHSHLIFSFRSRGEQVTIPIETLADGDYRYEAIAVIAKDSGNETEIAKRSTGRFTLSNGEIQPEPDPHDTFSHALQNTIGEFLSWIIPSAQADVFSVVEIESSFPGLRFDDTDVPSLQWLVAGYSSEFGVWDYATDGWVINILRDADNANSLAVDSGGNITLANDAVTIRRSTANVGIGTTTPSEDLDIHDPTPTLEFFDETDSTTAGLRYNSGLLQLRGNSDQSMIAMDATAPGNAIYINSAGHLGLGTNTPSEELEIRSSNPRIWLEDISSGSSDFSLGETAGTFTLEIEANGGGGPTGKAFVLNSDNGNFGLFSSFPDATLDVQSYDGQSAKIEVQNTTGTVAPRTLFELRNAGNTKFEIVNTDVNESWAFTNSGTDFRISRQGSGIVEFRVNNAGDAFLAGVLTENSDINAKQDIVPVNGQDLLNKLAALPISQWSYKDAPQDRHIGPMAQDFYAAFGLGATDKGIASLDSAGVALASIQALIQQNQQQQAQINQQQEQLQQQAMALQQLDQLKYDLAAQQQVILQLQQHLRPTSVENLLTAK